jgi:peptidoglycan/LPS O-acetylase OafA/YrhL
VTTDRVARVSSAPAAPISPVLDGDTPRPAPVGSDPGHVSGRVSGRISPRVSRRVSGRRPALDGIRALAVTAVAVYHFGGGKTSWLPGGFLGVDVFFVLSGYLITSLLLTEYSRQGRIDLLGFWVRRLRRLAPALLLMLLVVCGWIWWASPPDGYPQRRSDIFWTVGYLANWHLINTSETYFAAYTSASPLRHAWSLAIEEQFYLVWPAMLLALMWAGQRALRARADPSVRLPGLGRIDGGRLLVAVGALAGAGFSIGWLATRFDPLYPSHAYYSTQGRVQELFVGVLLAVAVPRLRRGAGRVLTVAAGVGLAGLLVAVLLLPDDTAFYYRGGALCACLAVAALIAGLEVRPGSALARAFSWRPAAALGRISYGVYLWHWPLVVAIPVTGGMPMREQVIRQGLRVLITLAAAAASYHLVEQPILRSRRVLRSPARVIAAALATSALVVGVTIPATALPGTLAEQIRYSSDRACPGERNDHLLICTWPIGADVTEHPVGLALLGDSTGRALGPGLNDWAERSGRSWVDAAWKLCTASGQLILPGNAGPDFAARTCHGQAPGLISEALDTYRPPVVLVAEYWAHNRTLLVDGRRLPAGTPEHDAAMRAGFLALVDKVSGYGGRVVFLEVPPPGDQLGRAVASGRPAGNSRGPVFGNGQYVDGFNAMLRTVAAARPASARTVSMTDVICPGGSCYPVQDGMLIRYDGVHYTTAFSRYLTPILLARIGVPDQLQP